MSETKVSKERMAEILNNSQYGSEISPEQEEVAKASDLIVIFGYSDDGLITKGVLDEEYGAYDGGDFIMCSTGEMIDEGASVEEALENSDLSDATRGMLQKFYDQEMENAVKINAKFDSEGYIWIISTDVPHSTFDILEDEEKFCKAIIIDLKDLGKKS